MSVSSELSIVNGAIAYLLYIFLRRQSPFLVLLAREVIDLLVSPLSEGAYLYISHHSLQSWLLPIDSLHVGNNLDHLIVSASTR